MRLLLIAIPALQAATVVDVETNSQVTSAQQMGDVIYTAEFSPSALKPGSIHEGERVRAGVKHGMLTVQLKNGKKATARIIRYSEFLVRPFPD